MTAKRTTKSTSATKAKVKVRRMETKKNNTKNKALDKDIRLFNANESSYKQDCAFHDCLVDICGNFESILDWNPKTKTRADVTEALEQYVSEFTQTIQEFEILRDKRYVKMKKLIGLKKE